MSWSVDIQGTPYPKEPIVSMCKCEGNLALATEKVGFKKLPHITKSKEAQKAILQVIEELDKENEGLFNDEWCEACDVSWSKGREMEEAWGKWEPLFNRTGDSKLNLPFSDKKTYWGRYKRSELRSSAVRFYLYYKAGYKITFTW